MADWPKPKVFRFADLELDEGQQCVLRNGKLIPLPKLSFDLLLALLEAAPNYLSNQQLMALVWPGLVVAEKTVSQRVKLLRDALGDDPDEWKYVAGLRGRGYRIPATVVRVDEYAGNEASGKSQPDIAGGSNRPRPFGLSMPALLGGSLIAVTLLGVVIWQWPGRPDASREAGNAATETVSIVEQGTTVAVLPFRDLSGDKVDAYFALGVPEMVLDELSTVSGLAVIARGSSFKAMKDGLSVQAVGEKLGARYIVDGSVQRNGGSLRVSAQLIDTQSGLQVWAEHFDRSVDDIFTIQDQIAARVSDAIGIRLLEAGAERKKPTENIDAYLAYLRGRVMLARWTVVDADAAIKAFEQALNLDPGFAAAYAGLYDARMMAENRRNGGASMKIAQSGNADDGETFRAFRASNQALIDKALALDPSSGAAYFARAVWADKDSATREADFRNGARLDPSNGRGLTAYAEFLDGAGRTDDAEYMLQRAIRIDPLSPRAYFWRVMRQRPFDPADAEAGMLQVLEIDPDYVPAMQRYAKYRWIMHGELAEAIQLIERALALDASNPWLLHTAIAMYLDVGDEKAARALLSGSERPEIAGRLLILLHDRDVIGAGSAALEESAFANGLYENWGVYEALRDYALRTGNYTQVIAQIDRYTFLGDRDTSISMKNFRAVPAFAEVRMLQGNGDDARALLEKCIRWIDEVHLPQLSDVYALRVKANALMLLGDTDLALQTLQSSFDSLDYLQWWYTIQRDPIWVTLHGTPAFDAIERTVNQYIERQAALLENLRANGMVPRHATAMPAPSNASDVASF
jgi:TolB-like protein/DNA-binding winged helix-turn-helix (wHTH) protein/Tfp pilus assembly protein PilF